MSTEGRDFSQVEENNDDNNLKLAKDLPEISSYGSHLKDNGFYHDDLCLGNTHDDFVQMIVELKFQNEYLKSQFRGLQIHCLESSKSYQQNQEAGAEGVASENVKELHDKIDSLSNDLLVEKQTRIAAEEALKHLRTVFSEADGKAQEFSVKLTEAQQKMKQEIKERDDKYAELDSKFSRLHKRAKQRIQEVQKEKDDIEAQLSDMNERAERTSSQLVALQQELERTRQQANEALKTMDMERQQLRSANNKLRDNVEELRHALEPKDHALENLQHLLSEKEQMLEDMRSQLQSADEKGHAALAELSAKHQKQVDSLEGELADAVLDRNKAADTISSLQVMVAEKESRIAEMDAALSGEAARLKAAVETVKGELAHQRHEHEKEKESWDAAHQVLKTKLEMAENNRIRAEVEAAKTRSQMELEFSMQNQLLNARDAELASLKEEISHLEAEFSSYKIRAHSLLQKKDAELVSAKDSEQVKALEEALKEAEKEILLMSAEKDQILKELKEAVVNHERVLAARDEVLGSVEQKIKGLETRVDSDRIQHQLEKESWELNLRNVEETWRLKCEALKAQNEESMGPNLHLQKEMEEFKLRYRKLKEEHDSFRDLADTMIEEKDKEISKLIDDNKKLQRSLELRAPVERNDDYSTVSSAFQRQEFSSTSAAEHQILILARQQAQREEELAQSQRHILALQEEIEELERENRLHNEQVSMLKEEFRNSERSRKREGVDMTYLKNVILKLLETGEVEALLPVVAMLLQFSPEEIQKCQQAYQNQAYQNSSNAPPSPAGDGSNKSLFSRFSFS